MLTELEKKGIAIRVASPKLVMEEGELAPLLCVRVCVCVYVLCMYINVCVSPSVYRTPYQLSPHYTKSTLLHPLPLTLTLPKTEHTQPLTTHTPTHRPPPAPSSYKDVCAVVDTCHNAGISNKVRVRVRVRVRGRGRGRGRGQGRMCACVCVFYVVIIYFLSVCCIFHQP